MYGLPTYHQKGVQLAVVQAKHTLGRSKFQCTAPEAVVYCNIHGEKGLFQVAKMIKPVNRPRYTTPLSSIRNAADTARFLESANGTSQRVLTFFFFPADTQVKPPH